MSLNPPDPAPPSPPTATDLPSGDPRAKLVGNVREALQALPFYFESKSEIEGLEAMDLFSLNSVLGGTIEIQTVATLNRIRNVWDPDEEWSEYGFQRFSQTFPDVRLVNRTAADHPPVMGIELKGWYLLAKEKQPSYRYTATRSACSIYDLLVVVPWHLGDVLSGVPVVRDPFVAQARWAAEFRNYYWRYQRGSQANGDIEEPVGVHPYPPPKTHTSDKPAEDRGGNFGRVARVHGLMDDYMNNALDAHISGIEARYWIEFFRVFADASDPQQVEGNMRRLLKRHVSGINEVRAEQVIEHLVEVQRLLSTGREQ